MLADRIAGESAIGLVMIRTRSATYGPNSMIMNPSQTADPRSRNWNRWAYFTFTLAGLAFWVVSEDRSLAATFLAIALVADPFDQTVTWNKRPLLQRAWLIVHLGLVAAAFGYWVGLMDRM